METYEDRVPGGAYGCYLLGVANERQGKYKEAKFFYRKTLEINPTIWAAYENLLKMGDNLKPEEVFSIDLPFKLENMQRYGRKKSAEELIKL